jgi:ketosteroid isomerase-like protein
MNQNESQIDRDTAVEEIKDIIVKYAQSIDNVDTDLAPQIWLQGDNVSFIHPRGHEHGWEQIKTNFYEMTMRDRFSNRKLNIHHVIIHVLNDSAWAEFYWNFIATLRKDGSTLETAGRESQVYSKSERGWSLIHVHYSGMPVSGEREGF